MKKWFVRRQTRMLTGRWVKSIRFMWRNSPRAIQLPIRDCLHMFSKKRNEEKTKKCEKRKRSGPNNLYILPHYFAHLLLQLIIGCYFRVMDSLVTWDGAPLSIHFILYRSNNEMIFNFIFIFISYFRS